MNDLRRKALTKTKVRAACPQNFPDMKNKEAKHEQSLGCGGVCVKLFHFAGRCADKSVKSKFPVGQGRKEGESPYIPLHYLCENF